MEQHISQLKSLLDCGRPWAARRAQIALRIQDQLSAGKISASEAAELLTDLIRTDKLDQEADSVETKALLIQAVSLAAKLV
jgi:polyhydroxyalkanoate synthesis regulator phasin